MSALASILGILVLFLVLAPLAITFALLAFFILLAQYAEPDDPGDGGEPVPEPGKLVCPIHRRAA